MNLTAIVNIAGRQFEIVTDEFDTPQDAADFFFYNDNTRFFVSEIRNDKGEVL